MPGLFDALALLAIVVALSGLDLNHARINVHNRLPSKQREIVEADTGAVAADDGRCSEIGRDVLREGGHAVDASVATALCLGVVSPASSGLGGGAFMLVRLATGEAEAYDMRETAPAAASQNMYANNPLSKSSGGLSVAVPGELAGLYRVWQKHGRLSWQRLVQPAIRLAKGFRVSPYLGYQIKVSKAAIFTDKGLRKHFTFNGKLLQAGDLCHNLKLAETLEAIAKVGPKIFYNGTVGIDLVKDVRSAGGILTLEDLQNYRVKVTQPVSTDIFGYKILGMPPPSSGGAGMILALNILASYGTPSAASGRVGLHRTIEALKHVFAVRPNIGDPDFVNVSKVLSDMLSPRFAAELRKTIYDNMTFGPSHYGDRWGGIKDHGTSHFCVVDSSRNAVSITSTVNAYFGAQILSPRTGIVLNNEMDDFSVPVKNSANVLPPAPANFIRPFKRPMSSMTPTIVLQDGQLRGVLGASGGSNIIGATTEVFLNYFWKKKDPWFSVAAPRAYHQLIPNIVYYENWTTVLGDHIVLPRMLRAALQKRGHKLQGGAERAICQLVVHDLHSHANMAEMAAQYPQKNVINGKLIAVSDLRKAGFPAGY